MATGLRARAAVAASHPGHAAGASLAPASQTEVDDHSESRVPVMLVVLGIAAFTVLGLGVAAYVVRRLLGRTSKPPDQSAAGHH